LVLDVNYLLIFMSYKTKKINALKVAYYFLKRGLEEKKPITNKKLQKLVYYAQVWSLVLNNKKLFNERIEAWVHGPAIPRLYSKFKKFEFDPITLDGSEFENLNFSNKQLDVLDNVWKVYGKYNAEYLEALTHSELPWQEARGDLPLSHPSNNVINLKTAKEYYARKLTESSK